MNQGCGGLNNVVIKYCKLCSKIYYREYNRKPEIKIKRKKFPSRLSLSRHKYYSSFRGQKTYRIHHLKTHYGMSIQEYNYLLKKQNYKCLICHSKQKDLLQKLSVDHNHKNGKIRGLLCDRCNRGLGYFKDNLVNLTSAINYLKKNETK